jgi:hypothetical protein
VKPWESNRSETPGFCSRNVAKAGGPQDQKAQPKEASITIATLTTVALNGDGRVGISSTNSVGRELLGWGFIVPKKLRNQGLLEEVFLFINFRDFGTVLLNLEIFLNVRLGI